MAITTTQQTSIMKASSALFNKAFSPEMVTDFVSFYESNGNDLAKLADALIGSSTYTAQYAGAATVAEFGTILMAHYGLSYTGTTAADTNMKNFIEYSFANKASWATSLQTIQAVDKYLTATFIPSLTTTDTVWGTMATAIENKATVATNFKNNASNAGKELSLASVTSDVATVTASTATATAGQTFTLAAGVDAITGGSGNDTINGYVDLTGTTSTLSAADTINGGAGTDTLNITVDGATSAGALPAATISNVEIFSIREVGGTAGVYDFAAVGGETAVINNKSADQLTLSNLASGTSVTVKGDGLITNGATVFTMAAVTDAVTLNFDGGVLGAANVTRNATGAATVVINSTGSENVATTAANVVGVIDLDTATALTGLTINATSNLTASLAADYAAASTLTATGAGVIDLTGAALSANFASVTASTMTAGGLKVQVSQGDTTVDTKFVGGAGNDTLDVGKVVYNSATLTAVGGNGTDTIQMNDAAALTAVTKNYITGFEVLSLTDDNDGAADTFDASLLSGITAIKLGVAATGDGYTLTNMSATQAAAVTVTGSQAIAANFGITGAATVGQLDTLAITTSTTNAAVTFTGGITAAGVETIQLTANTGTAATTVAALAHQDWTMLKLLGASDISVTTTATAAVINAVIDGSSATGKLTIDAALTTTNGLAIKGGTANDTITGSVQADAIDISTGGSDTLKDLKGGDVVTGFAGGANGDIIDYSGLGAVTALNAVMVDTDSTLKVLASTSTGAVVWAKGDVLAMSVATAADFDSKAEIGALFATGKVFEAATASDDVMLLIAAADTGKTYVYQLIEGDTNNTTLTDAADTVALVATLNGVSSTQLDAWTSANFIA